MENNRPYFLYTLVDPRNDVVKYVGCTINPKSRYSLHLREQSNKRKDLWIRELKAENLKPIMRIHLRTLDLKLAIKFEVLLFDEYDNGNLVCNDPRISRYVKKHDVKRMGMDNREELSPIVRLNLFRLLEANGISADFLSKKCRHFYGGSIDDLMNGKALFHPQDVFSIAKAFNADCDNFIIPDYDFKPTNDPEERYTNTWSYSRS